MVSCLSPRLAKFASQTKLNLTLNQSEKKKQNSTYFPDKDEKLGWEPNGQNYFASVIQTDGTVGVKKFEIISLPNTPVND